jgi:aspartate aminotransferase-like enzyme
MAKSYTLMTPGPVPLPPDVLESLALPMEHHRTPEFEATLARVWQGLKQVFVTDEAVFFHTSTGSGAMESAVVNTLSPGDEVLCVVSGKFGERWAEICDAYGIKVQRLNIEWGKSVTVAQVKAALDANANIKAVLTQACETSTGVLHPIRELAAITAQTPAILMIDAITALGAIAMPMDEWGLDVVIGGSQKAFMLPTGLSFISFSKKAWKLTETSRLPKYYFDLRKEKKANSAGDTFFSSAVMHVRALDVVLKNHLTHGLSSIIDRIQVLSKATIAAAEILGLEIFPEVPSPSLSVLVLPAAVDSQKVRAQMESEYQITVMGGQDQLKGKVIRIGNMGYIRNQDLLKTLDALVACIRKQKPDFSSDEKLKQAKKRALEILTSAPNGASQAN